MKENFENIVSPFASISLVTKNKRLFLSPESEEAIAKSLELVEKAKQEKITVTETTAALARYGPDIREIMQHYDEYFETKTQQHMSHRKGYNIIQVVTWDERKITNKLKKTKKVSVKTISDEKYQKNVMGELSKKIQTPGITAAELQPFMQPNLELLSDRSSSTYLIFEKAMSLINRIAEAEEKQSKESSIKEQNKSLVASQSTTITQLRNEIEQSTINWYTTPEGKQFKALLDEKLIKMDTIAKYVKLLSKVVHSFLIYAEKQGKLFDYPVTVLSILEDNPVSPNSIVTQHFEAVAESFDRFGEEVFAKKKWFGREIGDQTVAEYLLKSPDYKKWLELRDIEQKIQDLKENSTYKLFQHSTTKIEEKIRDSQELIKNTENKSRISDEILADIQKEKEKAWIELNAFLDAQTR